MLNNNKQIALIAATLCNFLIPFMSSSINIALPSIGEEFSVDAILLGWIATSYILIGAMLLIPIGKIADIYGRRMIFSCGILIYSFSTLLCAFSTSITWLLCFRILQGIGSGLIFGTSLAILTSVFPAGERGRALGINVAASYLGLSFGPVLGRDINPSPWMEKYILCHRAF